MTDGDLRRALKELLSTQPLAVLATTGGDAPYANLVAIAPANGPGGILFATTLHTRKAANLRKNPRVALLIDNRTNEVNDFRDALAVTALGIAREVPAGEREGMEAAYLNRHPYLLGFLRSPSTHLYRVAVFRYILVTRFQRVVEVEPDEAPDPSA
jgi:nitroimidazol reductase NimA-like FMN-containing flavoprotein (pyridoxamine 5'-phosphate oxidase superfamily)